MPRQRFTRLSQLEEEWADLIQVIVIQDEGPITLEFETSQQAHEARNRFYHYRRLLREDPRYADAAAQAEVILARNPIERADGMFELTFINRQRDTIATALRHALGNKSKRTALLEETPVEPTPQASSAGDDALVESMFDDEN